MSATGVPSDRFRVPAEAVRWTCPRAWTARPNPLPEGPERLWTQPEVVGDLRATALAFGRGIRRHVEVVVPAGPGWIGVVVDGLSGHGPPVCALTRATEEQLRGRGGPGALAGAHGSIVVLDIHDVSPVPSINALSEAATLRTVLPLPLKRKDAEPEVPAPLPAEALVVLVGTDAAFKKLRDDRPRVSTWLRHRIIVQTDILASPSNGRLLAERLRGFAASAGLSVPTPGALGALLEQCRSGARTGRLTDGLTFAEDVLMEAADAGSALNRRGLEGALARMAARNGAKETAHRDRVASGRVLLSVEGGIIGVANGLMVYGSGRSAYSIPGRVSARVSVGHEGVINVEREAKYSGRSFDKGVFLLTGFLRATFGRTAPLGLAASLAFEQSYGGIDGDSAMVAETVAILSALSGLPCLQSVAVTGAMNQRGELLPVGSVSRKIVGWWTSCRDLGMPRGAGVVLPRANLVDLHLPPKTQNDIATGAFSLWAVDRIEDAVELLLGTPAGVLRAGKYPPKSVYGQAYAAAEAMSQRLYSREAHTGSPAIDEPSEAAAAKEPETGAEPERGPQ